MFTCVASCSFASGLGVKFKFGLAFALVLVNSSSFRICYAAAVGAIYGVALFVLVTAPFFFLSSPSSLLFISVIIWLRFCHVTFQEVEDNYPKNLPDFCDVHVPFSISVLCCTR